MLTATLSSDVPLPRGRVLRYAADIRPVSMVLGSFLLHLAFFWFASPVVALIAMLPLVALSTMVAAFNHHHQHVNAFR